MAIFRWSLVRFVQVLGAMTRVGGQLFPSVVVLPVLRSTVEPDVRGRLVHRTAERFAAIANAVCCPAVLMTGVLLASRRGVSLASLDDAGYGRLLGMKLVLIVISVALAAWHGALATRSPRRARPLAIAGLAPSSGIVVFATGLVP